MEEKVYYGQVDRSDWPAGPWDGEPDKMQWQDGATGLPCLVVRAGMGSWCGYVGVTEGHKFFGNDDADPSVHGGVTFTGFCRPGQEEHGICHVPGPGEPDRVWWLGFDCAHASDLVPGTVNSYRRAGIELGQEEYRALEYVRSECVKLAQQLKAA